MADKNKSYVAHVIRQSPDVSWITKAATAYILK